MRAAMAQHRRGSFVKPPAAPQVPCRCGLIPGAAKPYTAAKTPNRESLPKPHPNRG